jgi:hypothetical protein
VRREEQRVARFSVGPEEPLDPLLHDRVEVGEGLVDEHHLGLVEERRREEYLLPFALREVRTEGVELVAELQPVGPRPDGGVDGLVGEAAGRPHELEVLPGGEKGGGPAVLGEDADRRARPDRLGDGVDAGDAGRPRVRPELAGEDVYRRGLAGPVRTEEAVQFPARHGERERVQRGDVAVAFRQLRRLDGRPAGGGSRSGIRHRRRLCRSGT